MPLTKNKLDAFVKRLDIVERFIKEEYVLKRKKLNAQLVSYLINSMFSVFKKIM
jgi:hypothetical protein